MYVYFVLLEAQEKLSSEEMTTTTQGEDSTVAQVNSNEESSTDTTNNSTNTSTETVSFKVIYNKQKHDVTFPLDKTVIDLKKHLEEITGKKFSKFIYFIIKLYKTCSQVNI